MRLIIPIILLLECKIQVVSCEKFWKLMRDNKLKNKDLLDTFSEHHAISQAQYDKSLGDLKTKMFPLLVEDNI